MSSRACWGAHLVGTARSLVSIVNPSVLRSRNKDSRNAPFARHSAKAAGGAALSLSPGNYGLPVYIALDLSMNEFFLFALTASIVAAIWASRAAATD